MIRLPGKVHRDISEWYQKGIPFLFVVDYKGERAYAWRLDEVPEDQVIYQIGGQTNRKKVVIDLHWKVIAPVSWEKYQKAFETVQSYQKAGENYLLNITFPTMVYLSESVWSVAHAVEARYVLGLKGECVVFSPETFVVLEERKISTFPMKGTISAEREENLDLLYNDPKEQAEHVAIVDLLRNDLGQVCSSVEVKRYRYWERVNRGRGDLFQTSSHIEGIVKKDLSLGEVFEAVLPAGSVTGVPKPRAIEIIDEVEEYERGWYTGVFGLFDGKRLESAVMIRYLEENPQGKVYKSGGGIMVYSDPKKEYQELLEKVYVPIF